MLGTFDPFGRPGITFAPTVTISGAPHRRRVTMFYEDAARRVRVESDLNAEGDRLLKTRTTSDQLGRTILTEQSENGSSYAITANTVYVQMGKITLVSNPTRNDGAASEGWTRATKDAAGRITEVATFGGAAQPPSSGTSGIWTGSVITTYDAEFTTVSDQIGKVRRSMTDALGRLRRVDEPDSNNNLGPTMAAVQPTSYSYDVFGNLRTVTQGVQTRTFTYDSLSRLRSASNPESGTSTYSYDDNGNLLSKTDARGIIVTYAYDALNRNTSADYSDSTPDTFRQYDLASNGKGRLNQVTQGGTTTAATYIDQYDALGRPLLQRQRFETGGVWSGDFTLQRTYDLAGHVKTQTYPSGRTVTYNYDLAGRLGDKDTENLAFTGNLGDGINRTYAAAIAYWAFGGMRQEKFGTDTAVYNKHFYNSRGQLSEIRESTQPENTNWNRGAIINHYSNQCWGMCAGQAMSDNNGNLKKQEVYVPDSAQGEWPAVVYTSWFNYDALNRLQDSNGVRWASGPNVLSDYWKQTFLPYDRYGNRRLDTNTNNTYPAYINKKDFTINPANNQLGVPGGQSGVLNYDAAGNLINDTYSSQTLGGSGARNYDAENRLISAQDVYGNWNYYTYDAEGQRVRRKVNGKDGWQVYGMDGELVAEYDANAATGSAPLKEYGYRQGQLLVTAEAVNLALGKPTTQSSTHASPTTNAEKAVDGNSNGALWDGYASATNYNTNAWWQVDLGSVQAIGAIQVWGRSDCCPEMTSNYYVFVSDNAFTSSDLTQTLNQPGVSNYYVPGYSGTPGTVSANRTGRYVRVQFAASQYLVLGEVKVLRNTAEVNWLVTDQLGTPRMIFDKTGSIESVKRHDYLPFGEEISAHGGRTTAQGYNIGDGIRQQFTERDNETGLDFFEARYYGSIPGRFTSADPIGGHTEDPQTLNRYTYVRNSPEVLTDPSGLDFYLTCEGDSSTCQNGRVGITDKKGNFTATIIKNDKNGNLVDQNGNRYEADINGRGVWFRQAGSESSTLGVFQNGTNATTIQGSGDLTGFTFNFTHSNLNANQTAAGTWTFNGNAEQAKQTLERAGYTNSIFDSYNFFHPNTDAYNSTDFRSPGDKESGRGSGHFSVHEAVETTLIIGPPWAGVGRARIPVRNSVPTRGDVHFGETYPFGSFRGLRKHSGEVIRSIRR